MDRSETHFYAPSIRLNKAAGGGRVERSVLLVWMIVGQGPFAVGAGGGYLDIFSLIHLFSFLSPSLWETARYRLKYCLKGPLNTKQPTNKAAVAKSGIPGLNYIGMDNFF